MFLVIGSRTCFLFSAESHMIKIYCLLFFSVNNENDVKTCMDLFYIACSIFEID